MTGSVRGSYPPREGLSQKRGTEEGVALGGAQDAVVWNGPVRSAMAFECFRITSSKAPSFQMRPFQMRVTVSSESARAFGTRPLSETSRSTSETIRQPETSVPLGGTPTMRRISIVTWTWRSRRRVANVTGRWEGARFLAGRHRPPPAPCLHSRSWRGTWLDPGYQAPRTCARGRRSGPGCLRRARCTLAAFRGRVRRWGAT